MLVFGVFVLCFPATAWAVQLDEATDVNVTHEKPLTEAPRLSKDNAFAGKELLISIGHDTLILNPVTNYHVFINEELIGEYASDYNGQLFVQVVIPTSLPAGEAKLQVKLQANSILEKTIVIVTD